MSRRDLRGSQNWGESWKVSGTGSPTETSTLERGGLNNKCDSANTWPWLCITKECWEAEEDIFKTKKIGSKSDFRFRSGSGRFSNMPYHIREPYWGLHESGNDLRKKKHNQGNSKSIIFYLIQEYRPNMLIECPTKTLQCLTSLFMIIPCDVNSSQNARVFCDALFKNEWNGCCVFLEFSRLFISSI